MPFKKGNKGNPKNQDSEGRVKLNCTFDDAKIYVTNKNKIIFRINHDGEPIVYFTNDIEDAKRFIKP